MASGKKKLIPDAAQNRLNELNKLNNIWKEASGKKKDHSRRSAKIYSRVGRLDLSFPTQPKSEIASSTKTFLAITKNFPMQQNKIPS